MTTQIDDQFTNWLLRAFTLPDLRTMGEAQRNSLRDAFFSGFSVAMANRISRADAADELTVFRDELGTDAAKTKARHCVQEAVIIKSAEN